ncbi:nuclear transport factor 2 family protein, partial [Kineococcus indalonis]|uniref:nuclear transport factor 2 family protein n=1 Tax=Kineococcus indalonis TaxID=2696566 RepID=UPI0014129084
MSIDTTTGLFQSYVEALLNGGDFARYFTEDVLWTTVDTGEEVRGRRAVAEHITALHTVVFDARPEVRASGAAGGHAGPVRSGVRP